MLRFYQEFYQSRKEDAEKKRLEALEKKKEREDMLAQETQNIAKAQAKANPIKVTRAQITDMQERREEIARGKSDKSEPETHLTAPLVENVNRLVLFLDGLYLIFERIASLYLRKVLTFKLNI